MTDPKIQELVAQVREVFEYEGYDETCTPVEALSRIAAHLEAMEKRVEREKHISNEWADAATNGLQWARNIRDGVSTVEQAVEALTSDINHCREVTEAPND